MKIAFIVDAFPTLSETFVLNQITGLIDRGHEVEIFARRRGDTSTVHPDVWEYRLLDSIYYSVSVPQNLFKRILKAIWLVFVNFHKKPFVILRSLNVFAYGREAASLRLLYDVLPYVGRKPYDIVHCHFGPNGRLITKLRKLGAIKGKLITTFHGYDVNSYPRKCGTDVYKELFHEADLLTVNTSFTANKVIEIGCPHSKIIKLPIGLDISKFSFDPRTYHRGDTVRILTVARLVEKKGIEYSIKSVAKVKKKQPNIEYRIVGDGELRKSLETLVKELKLTGTVYLLGWKISNEVLKLYEDAHIFVLSSVTAHNGDREGQGLVLQEAQAMGLPVLSTHHNGIPEGLLDGKSGFLVPERDVDALAERLSYLIQHPEVWPKMGQAGRAFVEANYDINKLNDRLVEIYQELVENGRCG